MSYSLLAGILGLDATDFLLHLLNFLLLVVIVSLLVYKPVIRFVHARRDEILAQEKLHDEKMKEAEETKEKYTSLIGSAEQEIAARRKEADTEAAKTRKPRWTTRANARKKFFPTPKKRRSGKRSRRLPQSRAKWRKSPCSSPPASSTRKLRRKKTQKSSTTA